MTTIKHSVLSMGAATVAWLATAPDAFATDSTDRKFGYSLTLIGTSDYMFRGLSYNNEDPAFQPYLEFTYGIAYVAFGGSNIADPYGPFEFDTYAGIRPTTGPISWDLGVLYYQYPGADNSGDVDYVEFKIGASATPVTNLTLGLTGYATPDQGDAYPETLTLEGSASYTLPSLGAITPTVSGLVGYTRSPAPTIVFYGESDYVYWNAGVRLDVEKFFVDLRYWNTNIAANALNGYDTGLVDSRFVVSAGVTLP